MQKSQESDERLMELVARGRREFLEPLLRRYASRLLTFIQRMVGDRHRSEELFQEVFLTVWTKRMQYEYPRSFRAWLFAIAANRCRQQLRRRGTATLSFDERSREVGVAAGKSPVEAALATETEQLVATAVGRLPAGQRTVVVLRIWNGLSYAEIAEIIGRSEATTRSHMHRGLSAMRTFLEPRLKS